MSGAVGAVLKTIGEALEHDYEECFRPRFNRASQVKKKELPYRAVDDLRNALDHFSKAITLAGMQDGTRSTQDAPSWLAESSEADRDPMVQVWRGRRHIACGEYHCIDYMVRWRLQLAGETVHSRLSQSTRNRAALIGELERLWRGLDGIKAPLDGGFDSVKANQDEILRIEGLRDELEGLLEPTDNFYERVKDLELGRAPL